MEFTRDDRAVSEVIGAILVFGLLIALLSVMQTYAVPLANEEVEFNHNEDVQSDLVNFQEASSRISSRGSQESVRIRMGTTYPTRLLFFNPPAPAAEIRTESGTDAEIQGVQATDETIQKYFEQQGNSLDNLQTKRVEYEPQYNEYQDSPTTVLEYGILYRDFDDQQLVEDEGKIVNGNSIDLTFYDGDISRTTGSALSLQSRPASAPARTVSVEPTGDTMTIRLQTRMSEESWNKVLEDELASNGGYVETIDHQGDHVEIHLDGNQRYQLRMAKIGVGDSVPEEDPQYLVETNGQGPSAIGMQVNTLPFEVRDRYNNPVSDQDVTITVDRGEFANGEQKVTATTNEEGRPNVRYTASEAGMVRVNASFNKDPDSADFDPEKNPEDLSFLMNVDPSQDRTDPVIDDEQTDVRMDEFFVCGSDTPIVGGLECTLGNDIIEFGQIVVDYSIIEEGGSGLASLEVEVYDEDGGEGNLLLTDAQGISGGEADGIYRSAQINQDDGVPESVVITVTDNNGNSDTYIENEL